MLKLAPVELNAQISAELDGRVIVDSEWKPLGVTGQFLENAETYHARYYNNDYWRCLVGRALELSHVDRDAALRILDIGSGSGNTVFAAAELLPGSIICANDISPQLLKILVGMQDYLPHLQNRVEAYCFDLHRDFFARNSFDLVIGGAILHHMLDPEAVLVNVAGWLRPGGKVLLVEPLEVGGHIITAIYLTLIGELEQEPDVDQRLLAFFKAMCHDSEARFGIPRIKPWTGHLDDKWMFHASYLRGVANNVGLTLETLAPTVTTLPTLFSDYVRGTLDVAGLGGVPTPSLLWELLGEFDMEVSNKLKSRLSPEGIIVLAKPHA